jgi:hypothetical protein
VVDQSRQTSDDGVAGIGYPDTGHAAYMEATFPVWMRIDMG